MRPLPDWFEERSLNKDMSPLYQAQLERDAKFKQYEERRRIAKERLQSNQPPIVPESEKTKEKTKENVQSNQSRISEGVKAVA